MSTYALISNGTVQNLVEWDGGADWSPPSGTTAVAVPAGTMVSPGWTFNAGTFANPNPPPVPTVPQQAQAAFNAAMAAGVAINSTGMPALNGTYSLSQASNQLLNGEMTYIAAFSTFSDGSTTNRPWIDQAGNIHVFGSIAEFQAFAKTCAQYVSALYLALNTALQNNTAFVAPAMPTALP